MDEIGQRVCGRELKASGGALSIRSGGFLALNFRVNRPEGRVVLQERPRGACRRKRSRGTRRGRRETGRGGREGEEERRLKEKVEAMVLGDLMRRGGRRGFPKQLAAISTDPIKINERAACESKPLRRPVCRSHSLFLFPLPPPPPPLPPPLALFSSRSFSLFRSFLFCTEVAD